MPRKNSGFGNPKSLSFKGVKSPNSKIDRIGKIKAAGSYPSDRRFGSLVQRTIIESYDAESDWIRWRKGYEYYVKAAMEDLIVAAPVKGSPAGDVAEAKGEVVYDPSFPRQDNPDNPGYNPQYIPFKQTAQLYSDTNFFLDVEFTGRRFSTKNSDTSNHYCIKRELTQPVNIFTVNKVLYPDDADKTLAKYATEAKLNNEIWVQGTREKDFALVARTIGDRLTDGEVNDANGVPVEVNGTATEATLIAGLTSDALPAVYTGKSTPEKPTQVTVRVRYQDLVGTDFFEKNNQDLNAYIGQIGYLPQLFNVQQFSPTNATNLTFKDDSYYFEVDLDDKIESTEGSTRFGFFILERDTSLPPSLYDIAELPSIFETETYEAYIKGTYLYKKSDYQRFFGNLYLTAELVESYVNSSSYPTLPFSIQTVSRADEGVFKGYYVDFTAQSFISTLDLFDVSETNDPGFLIFADYSFTQTKLDTDRAGNYLHRIEGPYQTVEEQAAGEEKFAKQVWYKKINDIQPYDKPFVNVFTQNNTGLRPATVYACSCPSYSKTQLRMPQPTQGADQRKINRQQNYPLPTAQSRTDYSSIGVNTAAGKMQSWQTNQQRSSFNVCKHTIASMFKDHLKLQEPNTYQTADAREEFGRKLEQDMKAQLELFQEAYARGGISLLEVVFAMGESLNYDEIDLAYIVLNSDSQAKAHSDYSNDGTINSQQFGRIL